MSDVHDVAAYILSRTGTVSAMKLQKLLYYSQAWHAAVTDEPLFDAPVQAWAQGPVVQEVQIQHRRRYNITSWQQGQGDRVGDGARQIIDMVIGQYGALTGDELSERTHSELPWNEARAGLSVDARSNRPIPVERMATYYRARTLGGFLPADLAAGGFASSDAISGDETLEELLTMARSGTSQLPETEVIGFGQAVGSSTGSSSQAALG